MPLIQNYRWSGKSFRFVFTVNIQVLSDNNPFQLHGAAYGKGIYLSPVSSISFGYSGITGIRCISVNIKTCCDCPASSAEMGKGRHRMPTKEELRRNCKPVNKQKQVAYCRSVMNSWNSRMHFFPTLCSLLSYLSNSSSSRVLLGSCTIGTWTASPSAKVRLRQYTQQWR